MKVISNILTIEVTNKEYEAMKTTLTLLNELYNALPSDYYDTEEYITNARDCLNLLVQNKLDNVAMRVVN